MQTKHFVVPTCIQSGKPLMTRMKRSISRGIRQTLAISLLMALGCDTYTTHDMSGLENQLGSKIDTPSSDDSPILVIDRADLVAYAPAGELAVLPIGADLLENFPDIDPKYLKERKTVVYVGPITPSARPGETEFDIGNLAQDYPDLDDVQGTRILWANLETMRAYMIIYPNLPGMSQGPDAGQDDLRYASGSFDVPGAEGKEDASAFVQEVDESNDPADINSARKERQMRGDLVGKDTRYRVFSDDEDVSGDLYRRVLSMSGGTGSMVGRQHYLTAAHVILDEHPTQASVVVIEDVRMRAGRNGPTQLGATARPLHMYFPLSYADGTSTLTDGFDIAWGVMDQPLGDLVGYFGYNASDRATPDRVAPPLTNVAYPSCRASSAPVPPDCVGSHIFRDSKNCVIFDDESPDEDGQTQAVHHGCDTNRGHSGSPLVMTAGAGLSVWAVHDGHSGGDNYAARITRRRAFDIFPDMYRRFPRSAGNAL